LVKSHLILFFVQRSGKQQKMENDCQFMQSQIRAARLVIGCSVGKKQYVAGRGVNNRQCQDEGWLKKEYKIYVARLHSRKISIRGPIA
jgi:hypothetical protein